MKKKRLLNIFFPIREIEATIRSIREAGWVFEDAETLSEKNIARLDMHRSRQELSRLLRLSTAKYRLAQGATVFLTITAAMSGYRMFIEDSPMSGLDWVYEISGLSLMVVTVSALMITLRQIRAKIDEVKGVLGDEGR